MKRHRKQETIQKVIGKLEYLDPKTPYFHLRELRALDTTKILAEESVLILDTEEVASKFFKYIRENCETNDEMLDKITRWYGVTKYKISRFHKCWIGFDYRVEWDDYNINYKEGYLANNTLYFIENKEILEWDEITNKLKVRSEFTK